MPYFIRQPYAEIEAPRRVEPRFDDTDILQLAKDVLASTDGADRRFRIRDPIRPGGQGAMVLNLAAEEGASPLAISLAATDLAGGGARIASDSIRISPSRLTIPAGGSADVTVTVLTPPNAPPGVYDGAISLTGDESDTIPFQVEVR